MLKKVTGTILSKLFPVRWKEFAELNYWKKVKNKEEIFTNDHYKEYYTDHFNLSESFYKEKRIIDIGCGPRGSLEWADMASERVGLDPLADNYLKLGADKHQMKYVASPSESIPYEDHYFDIVTSFNSLDHVHDLEKTIREMKRVTKPGGLILLLVEVNHEPTYCEPHLIKPDRLLDFFSPEFQCLTIELYQPSERGVYASIKNGKLINNPKNSDHRGWLSAKFVRS